MARSVVVAVSAITVIGAVAVGAPWLIGRQIEAGFRAAVADAPAHSPYPVTLLRYDRGLYSATAETRHLIAMEADDLPVVDEDGQIVTPPPRQQWVTLQHAISHGPRLDGLRLARIVNTLQLDGEPGARLTALFGAAEPLTVTVDVGLAGGYDGKIVSPAFEQPAAGLTWRGLDGRFRIDGDHVTGEITSRGLAAADGSLSIGPLRASGDLTVQADSVWTGRFDTQADAIAGRGPGGSMTLTGFRAESTTADASGSLRSTVSLGFERLDTDALKVSEGRLELAVDSLATKAMAALNAALNRQAAATAAGRDGAAETAAVQTALSAVAAGQPQLTLERLSFVADSGAFQLQGRARYIGDGELADFAPARDVEASVQFEAPLPLLEALMRHQATAATADLAPAPTPEQTAAQVKATLAGLVSEGLVQVTEDRGSTALEFKGGALTVNGKPIGAAPI